jgi:tyramine---L-glutamate ligase
MDMVGMAPRETIQVLVHEWVTGGGLAGSPMPASWAAEGRAMRRSIAADFASLPHVRVVRTLDEGQPDEPGPWTVVRVGPGEESDRFASLAARADFTALIAPESGGVLAERARAIERAGGRSLGSSPAAIELAGDKLRLGAHMIERGIVTPPCRCVVPSRGLPIDFPYPAVLKPIDGAGSMETYLVPDAGALPDAARTPGEALLQPFVLGVPMSESFLVGIDGRARLIGTGRQRVEVREGQFAYRGGEMPDAGGLPDHSPRHAVESVPGLLGFVGVDFLLDEGSGRVTVLEINPRPTTSYVALSWHLTPGVLARAWLDHVAGYPGEGGRDLAEIVQSHARVEFAADGTIDIGGSGA